MFSPFFCGTQSDPVQIQILGFIGSVVDSLLPVRFAICLW